MFFVVPVIGAAWHPCCLFCFDKIVATVYNKDMDDMKNIQTLSDWYVQHGETMPYINRFAQHSCTLPPVFVIDPILGCVYRFSNETIPLIKHLNLSNGIFVFSMAQFGANRRCVFTI